MLLSDKYNFLTNYFETAINNDKASLSHSILLYGNDFQSQIVLAKEIARLLNCKNEKSDSCECTNCKWIRDEKHPAVLIISRTDNKADGDKTKETISINQARMIRDSLVTASEFHRVFIFCDKDDDGNISGLNINNFPDATANALLKTIEEPTENVTFIFLTRDKSDVISTIVSRSQCFFVPTKEQYDYSFDLIKDVFTEYWTFERGEVFNLSEKLVRLSEEYGIENVLLQIQNYITLLLKSNPSEIKFISHIKMVEDAKNKMKQGMKPDIIFDDLCLNIIH